MKKDMPLEGLRWSRDSGSALYDTPQTAVLGRAGGSFFVAPLRRKKRRKSARRKKRHKSARRSCGFAIRRQKRLDLFNADLQSASSKIVYFRKSFSQRSF